MGELPSRNPRSPEEQSADAEAMQAYMRSDETQKPVRYILEGEDWVPVIPGNDDYKRALPDRYDKQTGMPVSPWAPEYESSAKRKPKRLR